MLSEIDKRYIDLHKAFIDFQAEMAQMKNDIINLKEGLAELIQKLTKAGYAV